MFTQHALDFPDAPLGYGSMLGRHHRADRIREAANLRSFPALAESMNEGRGECIACADGICNLDPKAGHLCKLSVFQN